MSCDSCKRRWSFYGTPLLERYKITCSRVNPNLKSIATEDFSNRNDQLLSPGFLERASKNIETEKVLDKVSESGPPYKRPRIAENSGDLRSFLSKGTPAKYGGRNFQHLPQLYNQQKDKPSSTRYLANEPHFLGVMAGGVSCCFAAW